MHSNGLHYYLRDQNTQDHMIKLDNSNFLLGEALSILTPLSYKPKYSGNITAAGIRRHMPD